MNKLLIILLHLITPCAFADSFTAPTTQTVSSPKGEFLLRSLPPLRLEGDKWSEMIFIVYRLEEATQDYREISRFPIDSHPDDFFINDTGDRIVIFGRAPGPRVVAVYDARGRELKKWDLKDFYDKKKIDKLPETTTLVLWRGKTGWMPYQNGILISKPELHGESNADLDDYLLDLKLLKITKRAPVLLNLDSSKK